MVFRALAEAEWIEMTERIKFFPLIVLGALVILGVLLYLVSVRSRPRGPVAGPAEAEAPRAQASPAAAPAASSRPIEAPAASRSPGDKILEGADGAFGSGMFPTALMFYKDFELRYAGTEVYDRNILRVWTRIHTSNASSDKEKQDPALGSYLETRRKLTDEWNRLRPLLAQPATDDSRAKLEKYEEALPPQDGRRKVIDAWRGPGKDGK